MNPLVAEGVNRVMNVTVVIPIYNMEKYLRQCLRSVLSQTLEDVEILCIDDGSTDGSLQILQKYHKTNPIIRILSQKNSGVGNTRNTGIQMARGKYIAFMDPDDYYPDKDVLKELYHAAEKTQAQICGGSFCKVIDEKIQTKFVGSERKYTFLQEGWIAYRDYQYDYGFHRFLYRKSFLIENHLQFPQYIRFQDPPFFTSAMATAQKFYVLPRIVYCYREKIGGFTWNYVRAVDLLKGLNDNLKLATRENLMELHALTVRRLLIEFQDIWVSNLSSEADELLILLMEAERLFDRKILNELQLEVGIVPIIQKVLLTAGADANSNLFEGYRRQLNQVYTSWNYRVGAGILYFPKKLCRFLLGAKFKQ